MSFKNYIVVLPLLGFVVPVTAVFQQGLMERPEVITLEPKHPVVLPSSKIFPPTSLQGQMYNSWQPQKPEFSKPAASSHAWTYAALAVGAAAVGSLVTYVWKKWVMPWWKKRTSVVSVEPAVEPPAPVEPAEQPAQRDPQSALTESEQAKQRIRLGDGDAKRAVEQSSAEPLKLYSCDQFTQTDDQNAGMSEGDRKGAAASSQGALSKPISDKQLLDRVRAITASIRDTSQDKKIDLTALNNSTDAEQKRQHEVPSEIRSNLGQEYLDENERSMASLAAFEAQMAAAVAAAAPLDDGAVSPGS